VRPPPEDYVREAAGREGSRARHAPATEPPQPARRAASKTIVGLPGPPNPRSHMRSVRQHRAHVVKAEAPEAATCPPKNPP